MLTIALIGLAAGAVAGLLGGIANVTEQNAQAEAAAAEATAQSAELTTQIDAATDIFGDQQAEFQAQLDAANQASQFEISQGRVAQERAVGSQVAQNAASGLGGASKTSVVDQLSADFDTQIGQLETARQEMLRAGQAEMDIAELEFTETTRQTTREADLLTAEAAQFEEESQFDLSDLGTIFTGTLAGLG